jgi:hypothetical protein
VQFRQQRGVHEFEQWMLLGEFGVFVGRKLGMFVRRWILGLLVGLWRVRGWWALARGFPVVSESRGKRKGRNDPDGARFRIPSDES